MSNQMNNTNQNKVFIYWDNSNIFHEAQRLGGERDGTPGARYLTRIDFDNFLRLAHADREIGRAVAAGSIPPEMRQLWNRMENRDVSVKLFERGALGGGEQGVPDQYLQLRMLEDLVDYNGDPGVVVLLTGDGAGYLEGTGFHSTLARMHQRDWKVEILSWENTCNKRMKKWAGENGIFVALDDFYESITYREPSNPGHEHALRRDVAPLDLSLRKLA